MTRHRSRRTANRIRVQPGLKLTSMMDILTVLLLFLLKSFVVEGEVMVPPPGVELPKSTAQSTPESSLIVAIDDDAILLGGERVASVRDAVASPAMEIAPLADRLETVWKRLDEIAALEGSGSAEAHVVTIQGDRDIEFRVLQKVMYTLNQSGFEHIALAVLKSS